MKEAPDSNAVRGPDLNASKPPWDSKLYRQIVLPNGLRAVLIQDTIAMQQGPVYAQEEGDSDSESEDPGPGNQDEQSSDGSDASEEGGNGPPVRDAAASILVGAGSMYDPKSCQGLAHFLEHLLFMGSEKYPGENDYEAFVAKHGGSDNAYTEWEYTNYHVTIPQDYIWGALDRLAQFFISPLMLETAVDRELLAIESEFKLNQNSDSCRLQQLICSTSRQDHPMAKFSWGNLRSLKEIPSRLGVDPLEELRTFYDRYYYAANMRLCVIGAYTLDEMEKRISSMFADVPPLPRKEGPYPLPVTPQTIGTFDCDYKSPVASAGFPLTKNSLGKVFRIIPIKEKHTVTITWQIACQNQNWKSKPADFLAHLLGHEASGSLLSYFRSRSWASTCMAGVGEEGSDRASTHALFSCTFVLSESGLGSWKEVVSAVYEYIGMLRFWAEKGWPEWIHDELKNINDVAFQYGDEESPEDTVESLVEEMAPHFQVPAERLLDGSSLLFDFDPEGIDILLNSFDPSNARIDIVSSSFGRDEDFPKDVVDSVETVISDLKPPAEPNTFEPAKMGKPNLEPMFGILFWCTSLSDSVLEEWRRAARAQEPSLAISLPPQNSFVPCCFDLKPLPANDSRHLLLNSSLKICLPVGKSKQWFAGCVLKYDASANKVLVLFEDDSEQWHVLDQPPSFFSSQLLVPGFESTLDSKKAKFKIVEVARQGEGPVRRYGDESDFETSGFPPPPPPLPSSRLPKQLHNTNILKMWYLQDRNFDRPIAELRLQVVCARANQSPLFRACAELLSALCSDKCLETSYLASVCELGSYISTTDVGFNFRFHGFDDKLLDLFEIVFDTFLGFHDQEDTLPPGITEARFNALLEIIRRGYRNSGMSSSSLCSNIRLQSLRPTIWSEKEKLEAISDLSIKDFVKYSTILLSQIAVECFFHGNVDLPSARTARDSIVNRVDKLGQKGLARKKYPAQSVAQLPKNDVPLSVILPSINTSEPNTAVELYIQIGKDNLKERTISQLLTYMMDEPIYDQIRTKDQFGYSVECDHRWTYGILGIYFKIITNVKSAQDCVDRLEQFLIDFRQTLEAMGTSDYLEHAVGLSTEKLEIFNSLSEETSHYWSEIVDGRFEWESYREEAISLREISQKDALAAFDQWLMPGTRRRAATFQVIGAADGRVSQDRPQPEHVDQYRQEQVQAFHKSCKGQTWGRVNSKLF